MSDSENSSSFCDDVRANQFILDSDLSLKVFAVIAMTIGVVVVIWSFVYFLRHRKEHVRMRGRNAFLLGCFSLGALLYVILYPVRVLIGPQNFSCRIQTLIFTAFTILLAQSSLFRLFSLVWKVRYNQLLIDETYVALKKGDMVLNPGSVRFVGARLNRQNKTNSSYYSNILNDEAPFESNVAKGKRRDCIGFYYIMTFFGWKPSTEYPEKLQIAHLLASNRFSSILFTICSVLLFSLAVLLVYVDFPLDEEPCFGCASNIDLIRVTQIAQLTWMVIVLIAAFSCVVILLKVPDSIGVKREMMVTIFCFLLLGILAIPLEFIFDDLEKRGEVDWQMLLSFIILFLVVYVLPYQVYVAKKNEVKMNDVEEAVKQVVADSKGCKALAMFLVSNLSLETLYFYKEATKWKIQYESLSIEEASGQARFIYRKYINDSAFLRINISHRCRAEIENMIDEENFESTIFDKAIHETFSLLATDIFPRFKKTKYYEAYMNEF